MRRRISIVSCCVLAFAAHAAAQSSSIGANRRAPSDPRTRTVREVAPTPEQSVLVKRSLIGVAPIEAKKFKPGDYLTIIVRQQTIYEADGTANARRQSDLRSELEAFLKFTDGGVGAAAFRRGKPNINYRGVFNQRNTGELDREDRLTARITATIIDVKPNGNLVFEATSTLHYQEEYQLMTLTGGCRSVDVTPDNTVLSTQVADLNIDVRTRGGVRNATRPGWLGTIYDWIRPL